MSLPEGLGARRWGSYRETRHGRIAQAVTNEDEATPVTDVLSDSGDNEFIQSPGATEKTVIKGFQISNRDSSGITIGLKAGTDGSPKFEVYLAAYETFDKNLIGRYWRLPISKPLIVNLSGDGDVLVTVEIEAGSEPGLEAVDLSDSQSMSEELVKDIATPLSDSQSIAEALAKDESTTLSDSQSISEEQVRTGDRSKALTDEQSIAESNAKTASSVLADSETIAEDSSINYNPGE